MAGEFGIPKELWTNGPQPGALYNFPGTGITGNHEAVKKTM